MSQQNDMNLDAGLPASLDAEKTLLGAVLLDNDAWGEIREKLRPDDFSLDSHRRIALRMSELIKEGSTVDIVTLSNRLRNNKEIEWVGGVAYLADLTNGLPRRPVITDYIAIVKDKAMLRRLMGICSGTIARASDQSEAALEVLGTLQNHIEKMSEGYRSPTSGPVVRFIADALARDEEEYRNKGGRHIPSGNRWFDWKTGGGYRCGRITLVCARPGVGKSSWALMSVAHNCILGNRSVIFSFEMEKEEILRGLIPYLVDVPGIVVDQPELRTVKQHELIRSAYNRILEDWERLLSIYDDDGDIDHLCWTMDRETSKENETSDTLIVVDHFGLISGGSKNTVERETEHSRQLRTRIKKKRHAALLDLMQFRKARNLEESNSAPTGNDVKGSGAIYEDAFACLILHREINKETRRLSNAALLDLCKLRRGGSTGSTTGEFDTRRLSFIAEPEIEYEENYSVGQD